MSAYRPSTTERIDSLRAFQNEIKKVDLREDSEFQRIIREAHAVLEVSDREMGDQLSVSRPTVNRWMNGKNLPYNAMRKYVAGWIDQQLASKIRRVEYNIRQSGTSEQFSSEKMIAMACN